MRDGENDGWRGDIWEIDQGGTRCGMGEIEGE